MTKFLLIVWLVTSNSIPLKLEVYKSIDNCNEAGRWWEGNQGLTNRQREHRCVPVE
jgi:hypothetical protein